MSRLASRIQTRRQSRIGLRVSSAPVTGTRAGDAYLDGVPYPANVMRFPSNSGIRGVLVEETTVNKITAAPGSGTLFNPGDTTGWTKGGDAASTLTVVTDAVALAAAGLPSGVNVYKLDNSAGTTAATATAAGTTGATTATSVQGRLRGTGSAIVRLSGETPAPIALTASYVHRKRENLVPAATTDQYVIEAAAGAVVYFCLPQMEMKAYCTQATIGTRAAETTTVQTQGLITPQAGTVIIKAYAGGDISSATAASTHLLWCTRDAAGNNDVSIIRASGGSSWLLRTKNATVATSISQSVPAANTTGWHHYGVRYGATEATFWADALKRITLATPNLPATLQPNSFIGCDAAGGSQWGQPIASVYYYTRELSDAEMAAATTGNLPPDFTATLRFSNGQMETILGHAWGASEYVALLDAAHAT